MLLAEKGLQTCGFIFLLRTDAIFNRPYLLYYTSLFHLSFIVYRLHDFLSNIVRFISKAIYSHRHGLLLFLLGFLPQSLQLEGSLLTSLKLFCCKVRKE